MTTTNANGEAVVTLNLDTRWERLRAWLIELTSDGKTAGVVDETDVLAKMRELDGHAL